MIYSIIQSQGVGSRGYMTMTLELRFENSCGRHHDLVIAARLGEESEFMYRLGFGFDRMDRALSTPDTKAASGTPLLYP